MVGKFLLFRVCTALFSLEQAGSLFSLLRADSVLLLFIRSTHSRRGVQQLLLPNPESTNQLLRSSLAFFFFFFFSSVFRLLTCSDSFTLVRVRLAVFSETGSRPDLLFLSFARLGFSLSLYFPNFYSSLSDTYKPLIFKIYWTGPEADGGEGLSIFLFSLKVKQRRK